MQQVHDSILRQVYAQPGDNRIGRMTTEREKMPLERCIECNATMKVSDMPNLGIFRSMCPRCLYYEDYHRDEDTGQIWCTESGHLDKRTEKIQYCTRCGMQLEAEHRTHIKITSESMLAERHELCRTCFDVIKYWLSSNSRVYESKRNE